MCEFSTCVWSTRARTYLLSDTGPQVCRKRASTGGHLNIRPGSPVVLALMSSLP